MRFLFLITLLISSCLYQAQNKKWIDSLKNVVTSANHDTLKANALISLCGYEIRQGNFNSALNYGDYAYDLSKRKNYKKGMANARNNIGAVYYSKGEYNKAIENYSLAAKIKEEIGDTKGMGRTTGNIGAIYSQQGNYPLALQFYFKALSVFEKIKDNDNMIAPLNNIGLIYIYNHDYEKARKIFNRLISHFKNNGITKDHVYTIALGNMGLIYKKDKDYATARNYFNEALDINRKSGDKPGEALTLTNLAELYAETKDTEASLRYFNEALGITEEIGDQQQTVTILTNIGTLYFNINNFKKSEEYCLKALQLAEKIGVKNAVYEACTTLSKIYAKEENYKNAYYFFSKAIANRDSVYNEENTKKAVAAEMNFEFEKKEATAKLEREKELVIAAAEKRRQNLIIAATSIGLVLVFILALLIFKNLQQNKKKNRIITEQKKVVEEKNKEILDSINYARRIQYTLLAHEEFLKENLPSHFVLFKPKDIVSGDYYWAAKKNNLFYFACCDSTGHGVPGAFMSLLNIGFLNEAITEKGISEPHAIFNYARERLINSISKEDQKDGFDGILLCWNKTENKIMYAAANNPPLLIAEGSVSELPYDKMPVGKGETTNSFTSHTINIKPNDSLYLFTDGYADQFGGPKGKKFKYKQLETLLLNISELNINDQKQKLDETFTKWKGPLEQVDDVCVIGLRF